MQRYFHNSSYEFSMATLYLLYFCFAEKSMEALLQFVCDYDIKELHKECDRYVTNKLRMSTVAHKDRLRYLILAERFALADALGHALSLLSCLTMEELTSLEHLEDLKSSTLCQIMRKHTRTKEFEPQHYACAPASFPVSKSICPCRLNITNAWRWILIIPYC